MMSSRVGRVDLLGQRIETSFFLSSFKSIFARLANIDEIVRCLFGCSQPNKQR